MKMTSLAAALSGALLLTFGLATASAQESVPASDAENTGSRWFVELSGAPTADGNTLAKVRAEKAAFRKDAQSAGINYVERRSFDVLFNGFSVEATSANRRRLSQISGVKALYPVYTVAAPSPEEAAGSAPELVSAITMTGAKQAQDDRGLTGNNVKVGIVDTGIDIDHPGFGGSGPPPERRRSQARVSPTVTTLWGITTTPAARVPH